MIFVQKGMTPLTSQQLNRRTQKYIDRDFPQWKRERSMRKSDGVFDAYMDNVEASTDINRTNNQFNWDLEQFRKATLRLEKYVLSVGIEESTFEMSTTELVFNEETQENELVTETIVIPGVDPLEATIEINVSNVSDEGVETNSIETVENPLITQDVLERSQSQSIVDNTSDEVKTFGVIEE